MTKSHRLVRALGAAVVVLGLCASCGDDDDDFGVGAPCSTHAHCMTGHCCDSKECGRGMCTYRCDDDRDCPPSTLCEHGVCFFACRGDLDCARGQTCEHDGVCEWE